MARPSKHYRKTWGDKKEVQGLRLCTDGRWRYKDANGKEVKFSEPNPVKAVDRFWAATKGLPAPTVRVAAPFNEATFTPEVKISGTFEKVNGKTQQTGIGYDIPSEAFWEHARQEYARDPRFFEMQIGKASAASISLKQIRAAYLDRSPALPASKNFTVAAFDRLVDFTGAKTLADLTQATLDSWRVELDRLGFLGDTKRGYYSRVKTIIGFAVICGFDAQQVSECLGRCKVLWSKDPPSKSNPTPITREQFHKLLATGNGSWRPWLLCGLNLCMHLDAVCDLQWSQIDLEKGTYSARRKKTGVPQVAILWKETIEALKAILKSQSPYVFLSRRGTRFFRTSRGNGFRRLADKAGYPDLTFEALRDGGFKISFETKGVEERFSRVWVGHKSPGLTDRYVLANPSCASGPCEAVYAAYGPFPL